MGCAVFTEVLNVRSNITISSGTAVMRLEFLNVIFPTNCAGVLKREKIYREGLLIDWGYFIPYGCHEFHIWQIDIINTSCAFHSFFTQLLKKKETSSCSLTFRKSKKEAISAKLNL